MCACVVKGIRWTRCLPPRVSRLQHAALSQNAHRPPHLDPRVTLRVCERVYIYWRRSCFAANWLLSLCNFLTLARPSWLSRTHQSHVYTFIFFLKNHSNFVNVDITAVRLLLCLFDRGGMPYTSVLNLLLLFLAWWFRFKTNQMYWKKPFPSQIFIPQILKHHFKKKQWICSSKAASCGRPAQPGTISTRWASESRKTRVEKTNTGPAGTLWPHSFELRTGPSLLNFPLFCVHSQW